MVDFPWWNKKPPAPVRFAEVKTTSLTYRSDHNVLKANTADWSWDAHSLDVAKPEHEYGKPGRVASHTKNTKMTVAVEFEVWPLHADPAPCTIRGTATFLGGVNFVKTTTLKGGRQTIEIESDKPILDKVAKVTGFFSWEVDVPGQNTFKSDNSWGLTVYLTMGFPKPLLNFDGNRFLPESGSTVKRMDKAVELVAATGETDPHAIAEKLMSLVPGYILQAPAGTSPALLNAGFPDYHNHAAGGAWPLADNLKQKAQCQAIVRLVRGVLFQIGCPGDHDKVHVWEQPADSTAGPPIQATSPAPNVFESTDPGGGLQFVSQKGNSAWKARLADTPIKPADVNKRLFTLADIGINVLEACLRVTNNGVVKYYAGGTSTPAGTVAVFSNAQDVLKVFQSLIYIEFNDTGTGFFVRKIVKTY